MFTPLVTFLSTGYFITILLLVYGVMSIVLSIRARKESKGWFWGLIAGILGVIAGIISLSKRQVPFVWL